MDFHASAISLPRPSHSATGDGMSHHVNASAHQPSNWIVRDAKALLKRVTKLHKSAHTLNQASDEDKDV
jgi:hypothetical protein